MLRVSFVYYRLMVGMYVECPVHHVEPELKMMAQALSITFNHFHFPSFYDGWGFTVGYCHQLCSYL